MLSITYKVTDPRGIHARPAGQLVKLLSSFKSNSKVGKAGSLVDGKRLLQVMKLAIQQGEILVIELDGPDEDQAKLATSKFLESNL